MTLQSEAAKARRRACRVAAAPNDKVAEIMALEDPDERWERLRQAGYCGRGAGSCRANDGKVAPRWKDDNGKVYAECKFHTLRALELNRKYSRRNGPTPHANRPNNAGPIEGRAALSAAAKAAWARPEVRERQTAAIREAAQKRVHDAAYHVAIREAGAKRSRNPTWRAAINKRAQDPEWQAGIESVAEAKTAKMVQDPEWRAAQAEGMKAMMADPERRAAHSEAIVAGAARKLSEAEEERIIRLYKEGRSLYGISREMGLGHRLTTGQPRINRVLRVLKNARVYMLPSERAKWRLKYGISARPTEAE